MARASTAANELDDRWVAARSALPSRRRSPSAVSLHLHDEFLPDNPSTAPVIAHSAVHVGRSTSRSHAGCRSLVAIVELASQPIVLAVRRQPHGLGVRRHLVGVRKPAITCSSHGHAGLVESKGVVHVLVAKAVDRSDHHAARRQAGQSRWPGPPRHRAGRRRIRRGRRGRSASRIRSTRRPRRRGPSAADATASPGGHRASGSRAAETRGGTRPGRATRSASAAASPPPALSP